MDSLNIIDVIGSVCVISRFESFGVHLRGIVWGVGQVEDLVVIGSKTVVSHWRFSKVFGSEIVYLNI